MRVPDAVESGTGTDNNFLSFLACYGKLALNFRDFPQEFRLQTHGFVETFHAKIFALQIIGSY